MNPFTTPGLFSWVELMTSDIGAAKRFYGEVFGWQFKQDSETYTEILANERAIGGMMASPPGCPAPPTWNLYVTVSDLQKIMDRAKQLGGSIAFGPKDIPQVGRFAVIRDPHGGDLMAIQYAMATTPNAETTTGPSAPKGSFSWIELMARDAAAAHAFYGELLGWSFQKMPAFNYEIICLGDQMVAGLMAMPTSCPQGTPSSWSVYVSVTSADTTCDKVKQLGGQVLVGPEDIPTVGRFAVVQDPQGAAICMMQWAPC